MCHWYCTNPCRNKRIPKIQGTVWCKQGLEIAPHRNTQHFVMMHHLLVSIYLLRKLICARTCALLLAMQASSSPLSLHGLDSGPGHRYLQLGPIKYDGHKQSPLSQIPPLHIAPCSRPHSPLQPNAKIMHTKAVAAKHLAMQRAILCVRDDNE